MLIDEQFSTLVHDIALLNSLGVQLVLVHGARPQIEKRLQQQNIQCHYEDDIRITDESTLPSVIEAIGSSRVEIEAQLSMGLANSPMHGASIRVVSGNMITARPIGVRKGIDFAHTGIVRSIDKEAILNHLTKNTIVLVSPLGYSPTGEVFNLRSEDVAMSVAKTLHAEKLIYLTDSDGIIDKENNLLQELTLNQAEKLLKNNKLNSQTTEYSLRNAMSACDAGVKRCHLINRHIDGALLLELFSRDGLGTLITSELFEGTRQACLEDIGGILELIAPLEQQGVLVRRSREQLELEIEHFIVTERDGMVVACASYYPYVHEHIAELACLAVHDQYLNQGRGDSLLNFIERKASQNNIQKLFVLTTQSAHWFLERKFIAAEFNNLPIKKRSLYNYQRNSKIFIKNIK
ncbi:N-acetylglutamate synthase [hydrothermal vent metagenome]|uniref:amino-acid N-acetyltransferase n=1 Tax=hydrothermal vent metagenome TaxID=652676 RepID=A0A3B1ABB5_9ZZZZ